MDADYIERLDKQNKDNFEKMFDDVRLNGVKIILTKGFPQNIYPFMHELNGGGRINFTEIKKVPPKTMSSNFFKHILILMDVRCYRNNGNLENLGIL
jgi:hypothetical protein